MIEQLFSNAAMNFVEYDMKTGYVKSVGSVIPSILDAVLEQNPNIIEVSEWPSDFDIYSYDVDLETKKLVKSQNPRINPCKQELPKNNMVVSDRQFYQQAAISGFISFEDAIKAVQSGFVPSILQNEIDSIADPKEQFGARMFLSGDTAFPRAHPLMVRIAEAFGLSESGMDEFFVAASRL